MSAQGTLGPLLIDISGTQLLEEDREILLNPWVGGVILFSRNFENKAQLKQLVSEIKSLKTPQLLVTIDQEGGKVQRIKAPLTQLPAMAELGYYYDENSDKAIAAAETLGWLMAIELLDLGIDMSFAPVLDLNYGQSQVIGSRSFHSSPAVVALLAGAWVKGMANAGMKATGKHFPGHGGVAADTHDEPATNSEALEQLELTDIKPFVELKNKLAAVMTAHIGFPKVDDKPVTYSSRWLKDYWRGQCQYQGVIISDDLCMQSAADFQPDVKRRVSLALEAGCDLLLLCNAREAVKEVLTTAAPTETDAQQKISTLYGTMGRVPSLEASPEWRAGQRIATEVASIRSLYSVEHQQANVGA